MPSCQPFWRALPFCWTVLGLAAPLQGQGQDSIAPGKIAHATRLTGETITIDGRLDDPAWRKAVFIGDFLLKDPVEFGRPTDSTMVAFMYDDHALYIGARMFSKDPRRVPTALTRRDQYGNAEHIVISLDPYFDHRTAYSFSLTASGSRRDYYHPKDTEDISTRDFSYDPVWEGKTSIDSLGWSAEFRIPFSQLRFNDIPAQTWGLNINRWVPERNEDVYWVVVSKTLAGFASRFGILKGIEGIAKSRRIEVLPYIASNGTFTGSREPRNPFDNGHEIDARAGADLKVGLGPNLTLDATVNPDFGQVEADPAVVNLTAFETFFPERRPFFTEGSQLLQGTVPDFFYTRRIGGEIHGVASGDFVDAPRNTRIISATKLTGRLSSGLSIGALGAITATEYARFVYLPDSTGRTKVEPLTTFGVVRLQQQFGRDASIAGLTLVNVRRSFGNDSTLPTLLTRDAISGGADWILRFKQGEYELSGHAGGSYVAGDTAAINLLQQSAVHYLQRPDAPHLRLDPNRTSLAGYTFRLRGDKNAGLWLWGNELDIKSPGYETNDAGRLQHTGYIDLSGDFNRRQTTPSRLFRQSTVGIFGNLNWNFDGDNQLALLRLFSRFTLNNFMGLAFNAGYAARAVSDVQTRGGPLMGTGRQVDANIGMSSNYATATSWNFRLAGSLGEFGGWNYTVNWGLTLRPASALEISVTPTYLRQVNPRQYVTQVGGGPAATFNNRYVFAHIDQSILSTQVRLNYIFSPGLTLELYAEPFAASGRYYDHGELAAPRSLQLRSYGTDGTTITQTSDTTFQVSDTRLGQMFSIPRLDFNRLSLRSNVVLRWEWHPGSTLFLVWQQNRSTFCPAATALQCPGRTRGGDLVGLGSLADAVRAPGDNFLAIKVSYWIPVN